MIQTKMSAITFNLCSLMAHALITVRAMLKLDLELLLTMMSFRGVLRSTTRWTLVREPVNVRGCWRPLKKLKEVHHACLDIEYEENPKRSAARRRAIAKQDYHATYIVVTDSEYLVKGITEWFPGWRVRLVIQLNLQR